MIRCNVLHCIGKIYNEEIFELLLNYLSDHQKEDLFNKCLDYATRQKLDVKFIKEGYQDGTSDLNESLSDLFRRWQVRKKFKSLIIRTARQWKDRIVNCYGELPGYFFRRNEYKRNH